MTLEQIVYVNAKGVSYPAMFGRILSEGEAEQLIVKEGIDFLRNGPYYINRRIRPHEIKIREPNPEPIKKAWQSKYPR